MLFSQSEQGYVDVQGTVKFDKRPIENAKIEIYENGLQIKQYASNISGRFDFQLDLNKTFVLAITKTGMVTKRIQFETYVPENEIGIWTYKFTVEIFPMVDGLNISILEKPIAIIKFDNTWGAFDYDEDYTNSILKDIDRLLKEYEDLKIQAYDKTIAQADEAFKNEEYEKAWELYDRAIDYNPYDMYPDDMKFQINRILAKRDALDKNYEKAIEKADIDFNAKNWEGATTFYKKALSYKDEAYPKQKLQEIETIIKQLAAGDEELKRIEEEFRKAMFAGDDFRKEKKYYEARDAYTKALSFKPQEQLPKDNIAELNILIAELEKNQSEDEAKKKGYNDAIALADQNFNEKNYTNAQINYQKALTFLPYEAYPQQKLKEIEKILANLDATNLNFQNFIAEADRFFNEKSYEKAKVQYQEALKVKPSEAYPQQKITEINNLLAGFEQNMKAYNNFIASADKFFNSQLWNEAKTNYTQASQIFPEEQYPKNKIAEIDQKLLALKSAEEQQQSLELGYNTAIQLGDKLFVEKQYEASKAEFEKALALKPKEKYPKNKIDEIQKILNNVNLQNQEYERLIAEADAKFVGLKYYEARDSYVKAQQIKSSENYPQIKIDEINQILAKIEEDRKNKEQLEIQYANLIAAADNEFKNESYDIAKENYQKALEIKASETYPRQKINEIDQILSKIQDIETRYANQIKNADIQFQNKNYEAAKLGYENALNIKPNESYPNSKLAEINQLLNELKAKEKEYAKLIAEADKAYAKADWEGAKLNYQNASVVFPNEMYPKNRIIEIENKLLAIKNAEEAQLAKDQAYNAAITNGDRFFAQTDYINAKTEFEKAISLKPNEKYPQTKLSDVNSKLAELKQIQEQYNGLIAKADNDMAAKNYEIALQGYNSANLLKPNEAYPKTKINELNKLLAQQKSQNDQYNQYITTADNYFNTENLELAKTNYENALKVKANEVYPKNKLKEINAILDAKAKQEQELLAKKEQYNKVIKDADKDYQLKNYQNAIKLYQNAQIILPNEAYPGNQINLINNLIAQQQQQLEQNYTAAIREGDQFYGNMKYAEAKASFEKALLYKPNEDYPIRKLRDIEVKMDQQNREAAENAEREKKYAEFVKKADDQFNAGDFTSAKSNYQNALNYKTSATYPQEQIIKCDKLIQAQKDAALAAAEAERQKQLQDSKSSFEENDFDFEGGERSGAFLSELAKKYPEGITVENYNKKGKKIKRVIVNRKGIAKEYIEVVYSYGTYYFRNGQNISKYIFLSETKE